MSLILNPYRFAAAGSSGTPVVTSFNTTSTRSDLNAYVGFRFTADANVTITHLGRWVISGNSGTHTVALFNAAGDTILASVSVDTSGATAGEFVYAELGSSYNLTNGTSYRLGTLESSGGDVWYDRVTDGSFTLDASFTLLGAAYGSSTTMTANAGAGSYGHPSALYI